jgi:Sulfatase
MGLEDKKHRSHLPIAKPERSGFMAYDAKDPDSKFPPIEQSRSPKGAPNILIILIDDAGFGSASAFGGPCLTPSAEILAAGAFAAQRFPRAACASPDRIALVLIGPILGHMMGGVRRARRHPPGCAAHRASCGNPQLGRNAGGAQAGPAPTNGSVCGLYGVHRPPCRTLARWPQEARHIRRHALYYIIGDNGASAEGTINGAYNEMANFNGLPGLETPEFLTERLDKLGGPESYNHYAVGWAHAMNTPYQWTKQVASHWGGTRNGTIVSWPKGIPAKGEIRSQFTI